MQVLARSLAVVALVAACGEGKPEPGGTVRIDASYQGASALQVELAVLQPLEHAVLGLRGVVAVRGEARADRVSVEVRFARGVTREDASEAVREALVGVSKQLPPDVSPPAITVGRPAAWVYAEVEAEQIDALRAELERLPGVAVVESCGERWPGLAIELDGDRLAARGLTADQVARVLTATDVSMPGGRLDLAGTSLAVRSSGGPTTAAELGELGLDGRGTRLSDVASLRLTAEPSCPAAAGGGVHLRVGLRTATGDRARARREVVRRLGAAVRDEPLALERDGHGTVREVSLDPTPLEATLLGHDLERLRAQAREATIELARAGGVGDVTCPACEDGDASEVVIDRDRAAASAVSSAELAAAVRWARPRLVAHLDAGDRRLDVTLGAPGSWRSLPVAFRGGVAVRVSDIARVVDDGGPAMILHLDGRRAVVVRASGQPGTSAGQVRAALAAALPDAVVLVADRRALEAEPWPR